MVILVNLLVIPVFLEPRYLWPPVPQPPSQLPHNLPRRHRDHRPGAEDGRRAVGVEKLVVLGGDDAADDAHDVGPAQAVGFGGILVRGYPEGEPCAIAERKRLELVSQGGRWRYYRPAGGAPTIQ